MNKFIQWGIGIMAVIAFVISVSGLVGGNQSDQQSFGRVGTQMPNGVTIGSAGTNNRNVIDTTCTPIVQATTIAATSTNIFDCAVTGITSSFSVTFAQVSTSTDWLRDAATRPFVITASKASTTAGYLSMVILNATNTAATVSPTTGGLATTTISVHAVQTQ